MHKLWLLLFVLSFDAFAQQQQSKAEQVLRSLAWQKGPTEARIGDKATIQVPAGYVFLDDGNTKKFLELAGNPPRDGHYLFAPQSLDWFSVFSFDETGYVKDDEKIDPDELLRVIKEGDKPGNEERKRLGMSAIYTDGWHVAPHYDLDTKRLEWGIRLRNEAGQPGINYTARILGRSGVMSAVLVSDPQSLNKDMAAFKDALKNFKYVPGQTYAEFKQGDKVAAYGLAALVVGGAAAAAAKAGLFKGLGKFLWVAIAAGIAAVWGGIRALLRRRRTNQ